MAATASGRRLGVDDNLRLRERELAAVLEEFRTLPAAERQPKITVPNDVAPADRPVPRPPEGGLIVRGFCTYMKRDDEGRAVRSKEFYYKENPDRWAAETQSDMLWLTADEAASLVPDDPRVGGRAPVAEAIQQRFFSTIGIDYMEGSVNSLPTRETRMTLTVERATPHRIELRLDGYGRMGKEFDPELRDEPRSRGCELRVLGYVTYDRQRSAFERFDVVGVGQAWGNKMSYVHRAIRIDRYPWMYGIACELVTGDSPYDLIPPYNMLHYGSAGPYFAKD